MQKSDEDSTWKRKIISKDNTFMTMFQSLTKTSAMAIGEVEANDFVELKGWVAGLLFITFLVIVVILLQNLMTSLAVDDVNKLRKHSDKKLLKIKVDYCIEVLYCSEYFQCCSKCFQCCSKTPLFKQIMNDVTVIYDEGNDMFTTTTERLKRNTPSDNSSEACCCVLKCCNNEHDKLSIDERSEFTDEETLCTKFGRWLIGINWNALRKTNEEDDISQSDLLESTRDEIKALKEEIQNLKLNLPSISPKTIYESCKSSLSSVK
ncbi:hypothetical protein FO519_007985 [Halicephalobus sp. NKZ332]|nr:hypothetical protein FO519_007985 [Halicephalobus sp. NKZ332]